MSTPRVRVAAAARAAVATLAAGALLWGAGAWGAAPRVSYTPVPVVAAPAPAPPAPIPSTAGQASTAVPGSADPVSYTEGRLRVAGLVDVPVVQTVGVDEEGVVRPSTMTGAALVDLPGVAATVYVMHAGGATPGTALSGPDGEPAVKIGDLLVTPDGEIATVTAAFVAEKDETGERAAAAFTAAENVVVITCRPEGAAVSTSNVVVVARRA